MRENLQQTTGSPQMLHSSFYQEPEQRHAHLCPEDTDN